MDKIIKKILLEVKGELELEKGKKVESEHKGMYSKLKNYCEEHEKLPPPNMIYKWIAEDHIKEHKDYYTKLLNAGL